MSDAKKPDNIVFNTKTQQYDAALKPYATNVGAPAIQVTENITWKNKNVNKANKQLKAKYLELKAEYDKMIEEQKCSDQYENSKEELEVEVEKLDFHDQVKRYLDTLYLNEKYSQMKVSS